MINVNLKYLFLLCFIFCSTSDLIHAQEAMSTDRPNATEGSYVLSPHVLQFELGYHYSNIDQTNGEITTNGFGGLIRFGLFNNFEVRISIDHSKVSMDDIEQDISGLSPVVIGFKTMLKKENKFYPAISFLGQLGIAKTGIEDFQLGNAAPSFRFIFEKSLNDIFSLSANYGMLWNGFDATPSSISTFSTGIVLTDWLGSYLELESKYNKNSADEHIFNFGFTAWIESNTQLDFNYGIGLTDVAIENQMTVGISLRLFK